MGRVQPRAQWQKSRPSVHMYVWRRVPVGVLDGEQLITDARSGKRNVSNAQRIIPGGMAPSRQRFKDELAGLDEEGRRAHCRAPRRAARGEAEDAGTARPASSRSGAQIRGRGGWAGGNENLATAAELARALFPAPFELADNVSTEVVATITKDRQARPRAVPAQRARASGQRVRRGRRPSASREGQQRRRSSPSASLRRLVQLRSSSAALGGRAIRSLRQSILDDVKALTDFCEPGIGRPSLRQAISRSQLHRKDVERKGDKAAFEEFDKQILDLLAAMDKAVGRNTLVVATQTYEAVMEVLDAVNRVEQMKVDRLEHEGHDEATTSASRFSRRRCHRVAPSIQEHHERPREPIEAKATELERRRPIAVGDACEVKATATIKSGDADLCARLGDTGLRRCRHRDARAALC